MPWVYEYRCKTCGKTKLAMPFAAICEEHGSMECKELAPIRCDKCGGFHPALFNCTRPESWSANIA